MSNSLIRKYNVPGPRYTSYPTVPYWDNSPRPDEWMQSVSDTFRATNRSEGISLYVHLPYCEKLCTYCACNTRITINHGVELPYIQAVLSEWEMYKSRFDEAPRIREIHYGGGTPTFFSAENLKLLTEGLLAGSEKHPEADFSFEAHPANTSREHLETLYDLGFRRLSLGIQDFDPAVQKMINRLQTFEEVREVTETARQIGYTSVNYDLIYGLPLQNRETIRKTIDLVNELRPDRIAFYAYAHVPWVKPGQRMFSEKDLPANEEKRELYEIGRELLEQKGYLEIGMDHFALPTDSLYSAMQNGKMHRNFMGYTAGKTELLIGLGVSSLSDSGTVFAQNYKKVEEYVREIKAGNSPVFKGHLLNREDRLLRRHILNLMCRFETEWESPDMRLDDLPEILSALEPMFADNLCEIQGQKLQISEAGRPFVRNISMAFDARLRRKSTEKAVFSATV